MLALAWLGLAIAAAMVEVLSPIFGFVFVSFGAVLAAAGAWLGLPIEGQLLLFAASTVGSLVAVRPRLLAAKGRPALPSRTDRLIGQPGRVTEAIDPVSGGGRVLVAGEDWAARASEPVPVGSQIIVHGADGIVLNVTPEE